MISTRPLTALADAQAELLAMLAPVAPREIACAASVGMIAAELAPLAVPHPPHAVALRAGYALRAQDLVGASAFSPVTLSAPPQSVAPGEALCEGCDCVLEAAALDLSGPMAQAVVESWPGENVRRIGEDFPAGALLVAPGAAISPRDALVAARVGFPTLPVRLPRVAILGASDETGAFLSHRVRACGAEVSEADGAHLAIVLGDAPNGAVILTHGLALEPGRDCAVGRLGATPLIVLPRQPEQALAGFLALVRPALDRLASRNPAPTLGLPLATKISSRVGVAELAFLQAQDGSFLQLAVGDGPLLALSRATHVALIGAGSEGHAAGEICAADPIEA